MIPLIDTHLPTLNYQEILQNIGIYGMSGNVMEWTSTNWTDNYATSTTPDASTFVVRGGSWMGSANTCRVSYRNHYSPSTRRNNVGLRLAK